MSVPGGKASCGSLRSADDGRTVELNGWVNRRRDHGGLIFIDVRDREGVTQVVFNPESPSFANAETLRHEDVVSLGGTVRRRPAGTENRELATGEIELRAEQLRVLARSKTPPFPVTGDEDVDENLRLEYRYLDLRRPRLQRNLTVRHRIFKTMRDFFDAHGFLEIETPALIKSTPEGARDYLVPSRLHHGAFYALPQSPQLLKQLLMVAGLGRYMQLPRCFRDEDLRSDRQPEFTQLDVELAFTSEADVLDLLEECMCTVWREALGIAVPRPFPRLAHAEALERFGSDKPDLRFALELADASDHFRDSEFATFRTIVADGGAVYAVPYPGGAALSRRDFDVLTELAKTFGGKGMAWLVREPEQTRGSIARFVAEGQARTLFELAHCETGDALLFVGDGRERAQAVAGRLRNEVGARCGFADKKAFRFAWITGFPLFERDPESGTIGSSHHPFTAPAPGDEALLESEPLSVRAQHYDLVLNGYELGSGSIRVHEAELQRKIFATLGMAPETVEERFGFFLRALDYGAPPHGGIALGMDRIVMLACGEDNIRDVIAFPKNQVARDVMMDAPASVPAESLRELGLTLRSGP